MALGCNTEERQERGGSRASPFCLAIAPFIGWVEFILSRMYTAEPLNAFGCF